MIVYLIVIFDYKHIVIGETNNLNRVLFEYECLYGYNIEFYEFKFVSLHAFKKHFEKYKLYENMYSLKYLNKYIHFFLNNITTF